MKLSTVYLSLHYIPSWLRGRSGAWPTWIPYVIGAIIFAAAVTWIGALMAKTVSVAVN